MNFTSLQYFLTTAQELNITKAASRLFISQQALSEHINKLERELNVQLFNRTRPMTLTYAGRQMSEYAARILSLEKQMSQAAWDISKNKRGELRIGMSHTCSRAILPHILPEYKRTHPLVDIKLTEGNSKHLETLLERAELDLMIGFAPFGIDNVTSMPLTDERLFLVAPKTLLMQYFGACYSAIVSECKRCLDMSLFKPMPFILLQEGNRTRTLIDMHMAASNFKPNIILETDNIETAYALAEKGMGFTAYPELYYWCLHSVERAEQSHVELFAMGEGINLGSLQICWISGRYQPVATKDFVEMCVEILDDLEKKHTGMEPI